VSIIEELASKIAGKISEKLALDEERKAVITYGFIGILQIATLFILITVLGLITGTLYESYIVFFSVAFLRKSTGGAHAATMWGCNALSVVSILVLALLSRYVFGVHLPITVNIAVTIAIFILGLLIFYRKVPVDSPNKPITSEAKIKRLRKESFIKLILLFVAAVLCIMNTERFERLYSIASSIRVALFWQMITLTKRGASALHKLDQALSGLLRG
jgi:accessory gene regulator B